MFLPPILHLYWILAVIYWRLNIWGGRFIKTSVISTVSVSLFYKVWELFPPMLPNLLPYPLLAALCGGAFVGIGVGIIVRQGGSSGGDDALALTISRVTHWRLSRCYLFTDFVVLGFSLTYIPFSKIVFSIITVTISSYLIDRVQSFKLCTQFKGENKGERMVLPSKILDEKE
ncbi:MAG: YitT family protein [Christensenellales bacterium]